MRGGVDQYPFFNYLTQKTEMCGKLSMVSQSEKGGSTEPPEPPSGGPEFDWLCLNKSILTMACEYKVTS